MRRATHRAAAMSNGSRYSRRHYEDIARLLGTQSLFRMSTEDLDCMCLGSSCSVCFQMGYIADDLQQRLVALFTDDNPRFNAERFLTEIRNVRIRAMNTEGLA